MRDGDRPVRLEEKEKERGEEKVLLNGTRDICDIASSVVYRAVELL